jgi:GrpB-like predicted nucleotidyltransferase (UPF0157 family)
VYPGALAERRLRSAAVLGDPEDTAAYEEALARITIGGVAPLTQRIELHEYDPRWPELYAREERRIRDALDDRVVRIEHTGSTSVPGLSAKPIVDISLEVPDSADEEAYVPSLEAAGYVLSIREPDWYEHRLLRGFDPPVNLHVFNPGCEEVEQMRVLRDWLRTHEDDRDLYARAKRELAAKQWKYVQNYADAKSEVIQEILARARA